MSKAARFTPSFILGTLAVPLSAVAAFALVTSLGDVSDAGATDTAIEAVTTVAATTTTGTTTGMIGTFPETTTAAAEPIALVHELEHDPVADLALACGNDGQALTDKEEIGTITPLEQAALDALRPICDAADLVLTGPPPPPPDVRTVRVAKAGSGDTMAPPPAYSDDDDDGDDDSSYEDDDDNDGHEDDDDDHEDGDDHQDDD